MFKFKSCIYPEYLKSLIVQPRSGVTRVPVAPGRTSQLTPPELLKYQLHDKCMDYKVMSNFKILFGAPYSGTPGRLPSPAPLSYATG